MTHSQLHADKEVNEEYLKASGLTNASLHLGEFTENLWTQNVMKPTPTGFNIGVPKYSLTAQQAFPWVYNDVSEAALALSKSYTFKDVSGKVYPVVTARMTYPAALISKNMFSGGGNNLHQRAYDGERSFEALLEKIVNLNLVALGAKFGTIHELMETEIKKRFAK
ncbi:hypothetical protein B0H19DRAFT_1265589 [Mycena capillaripes]|nr:hypothetical protein B0H19DRAFT_1265589 [Mycena capillaripes]